MRTFKYIVQFLVLLVLVIGGIFFGSENTDAIRIVVLGNLTDPIPIWFVVLLAFFVGAALSGIYFSVELFRLWMKVRRIERGGGSTFKSSTSTGGFRFSNPSSTPTDYGNKPRFAPFGSPGTPRPFGPPSGGTSGSGNDDR